MTKHRAITISMFCSDETLATQVPQLLYMNGIDIITAADSVEEIHTMLATSDPRNPHLALVDQTANPDTANKVRKLAEQRRRTAIVMIANRNDIGDTSRRTVLEAPVDAGQIADQMLFHYRQLRDEPADPGNTGSSVVWLYPQASRARIHNREVTLSDSEYTLLELLARTPYSTLPKKQVAAAIRNTSKVTSKDIRATEKVAHQLHRTLAAHQLDAVREPAGIGFQLLPTHAAKEYGDNPVTVLA